MGDNGDLNKDVNRFFDFSNSNIGNILSRMKGFKKRRNLLIILAIANGFTQLEVAGKFKLDKSVVSRIARRHNELLNELVFKCDLATKAGRLKIAFREIRRKTGNSKKDLLDWVEYSRKEIEGDKPLIDNSLHQHYTLEVVENNAEHTTEPAQEPKNRME